MTNYAPPPAPPPPGYPPSQGYQPPPGAPRSNGWALASLICGIFGCVPLITSLCAVIFGIAGVRKANEPHTGGKGMAIAGLILGILGLVGWPVVGGTMYWGWQKAKQIVFEPSKQTGTTFLTSLASGDVATAQSVTTGDMTQAELGALRDKVKDLGAFKEFQLSGFDAKSTGGETFRVTASGTAVFDKGNRGFDATLIGSKSGVKIEDFKLH
jgi:hypothetical protein